MAATQIPQPIRLDEVTSYVVGDRLCWQGRDVEVVEVVEVTPGYEQVVLRFLDRRHALPVSIPMTELVAGASR
jgi:hypothetical protein